ncbi:TetR/AcrR family transcriptional regulator [Paramicrobacterium chengjingii]|uniref:TetR/AcrR family transcriptional regulator n=1 Tax=Paramicrobacterium chengjingii TaxID=2769067 RepID=A0ABX6YHG8_9MICO|nr:TetR/AcrR family transcriptional regulator [Microbacterium chengjingii]QPZ38050.1 TetR/AcrR family transcriptional regulator [Microbacterium chengjingii]
MVDDISHSPEQTDARSAIIDAAARLLNDKGADAVTTRRVSAEAGVQPPTLYRIFGDKNGLLDAVAEHVMAEFVAAKSATVSAALANDTDPVDDLRAGWEMQIEFGLRNPVLFSLVNAPERGSASPAAQAGLEILQTRVHRVAAAGRLRVSERRAVDLIRSAGSGVTFTLLTTPPDDRDPTLGTAMIDAVLREILVDAPERPRDSRHATAVAFRAIAPELTALSDAERGLLVDWLDRAIDGEAR